MFSGALSIGRFVVSRWRLAADAGLWVFNRQLAFYA
jgi:hypothetical protein